MPKIKSMEDIWSTDGAATHFEKMAYLQTTPARPIATTTPIPRRKK